MVIIPLKKWVEHYCLGKNHTSGTLSIPAAKSIAAVKSQNFVNFTGAQKSTQKNFGTRYITTNMKLIIFLKFRKETVV